MAAHINATIENFGYPGSLIADLGAWVVLLRPKQITIGSLILAAADPATAFSDVAPMTAAALPDAITRIERGLKAAIGYDKINYLMLMMVDPHVHFHVIPRHAGPVKFLGKEYPDTAWPKPPVMSDALDLDVASMNALRDVLAQAIAP
ncbi:MAG: HIT family protein [Rhodobacteraceae bacterium]|nr:HIT family protein [Paracoccaceae bacterium]